MQMPKVAMLRPLIGTVTLLRQVGGHRQRLPLVIKLAPSVENLYSILSHRATPVLLD